MTIKYGMPFGSESAKSAGLDQLKLLRVEQSFEHPLVDIIERRLGPLCAGRLVPASIPTFAGPATILDGMPSGEDVALVTIWKTMVSWSYGTTCVVGTVALVALGRADQRELKLVCAAGYDPTGVFAMALYEAVCVTSEWMERFAVLSVVATSRRSLDAAECQKISALERLVGQRLLDRKTHEKPMVMEALKEGFRSAPTSHRAASISPYVPWAIGPAFAQLVRPPRVRRGRKPSSLP